MPSMAKKRFLRKEYRKHFARSFQKTKSAQTNGLVFAERIEHVKNTKKVLELLKIVDCFPDAYDDYTSNLVSSTTKFY